MSGAKGLVSFGYGLTFIIFCMMIYRYKSINTQTFTPTTQYFSEMGYTDANTRYLFVAWGVLYTILLAVTFGLIAVNAKLSKIALICPSIMLYCLTIAFLAPLNSMPVVHASYILAGAFFLLASVVTFGILLKGFYNTLITLLSTLVISVYIAYELTQSNPQIKRRGLNPYHGHGPILQKLTFAAVLLINVWIANEMYDSFEIK